MLKVARNVCHAASLAERGLMSGDAYGSGGDKDKRMRELESQVRDLRNGRGDKERQDRDNGERDRARDEERRRDRRKVTDNKMAETWRGVCGVCAGRSGAEDLD